MKPPPIYGFLNVNKPHGVTSMEVVRRVKRITNQRKVGHGGTLDPSATGVLPICFGQATRLMDYLINGSKVYRAVIELGVTTDTYDSAGEVVKRGDFSVIARERFEDVLGSSFTGSIHQVPPMYSALKKDGRRLYDLARSGLEVERQARRVHVFRATVEEWASPYVGLLIECGRGVYIRSFAHDIGEALGCGAYLKDLVRVRSGPFDLADSIPMSNLEETDPAFDWREHVYALDYAVKDLRAVVVGSRIEQMVSRGRPISQNFRVPPARPEQQCRAYSTDGRFLGILTFDGSERHWRPLKVFSVSPAPREA